MSQAPARWLRAGVVFVLVFVPSCPAEDGTRPLSQAFVPVASPATGWLWKRSSAALQTQKNTQQLRHAPTRASPLVLRMTGSIASGRRVVASEARWRVAVFHVIVTFSTAVLEIADVALRVALFALHAFRAVLYAVGLRAVTTGIFSLVLSPLRQVQSALFETNRSLSDDAMGALVGSSLSSLICWLVLTLNHTHTQGCFDA